jgi:hypothetical protein
MTMSSAEDFPFTIEIITYSTAHSFEFYADTLSLQQILVDEVLIPELFLNRITRM